MGSAGCFWPDFYSEIENKRAEWKDLKKYIQSGQKKNMLKVVNREGEVMVVEDIFIFTKK